MLPSLYFLYAHYFNNFLYLILKSLDFFQFYFHFYLIKSLKHSIFLISRWFVANFSFLFLFASNNKKASQPILTELTSQK